MDYSVICPSCTHAFSIETRSFEIAYPLDYENRIRKFFSNKCTKCGETINIKRVTVKSRNPEAGLNYQRDNMTGTIFSGNETSFKLPEPN